MVSVRISKDEVKDIVQQAKDGKMTYAELATKLDKIKKTQVSKNIETIRTKLNASKDCDIIAYRSQTKEGLDKIYKYFEDYGEV